MPVAVTEPTIAITADQRAELRSTGMLAVPGALSPPAVSSLTAALDRVYSEERARAKLNDGDAMHLVGGIGRDAAFLELLDHPAAFTVIWGELGWNIHVYHVHLDVTPPRTAPRPRPVWRWHQDGGRQNLDLDSSPRPRMSLKVAYWLSDLTVSGRGNMLVIRGSHERNTLARQRLPEGGFADPPGAIPVLAEPGDALIFDRRLWHSRSDNLSGITRKAIFLAYTYRWIQARDDLGIEQGTACFSRLSPVRRQLLGEDASPHSQWGMGSAQIPLRVELDRRGLLDPSIPSHR